MSEKIVKNSIIVLALIALGKGLSFIRDILVSYYFGATGNTDAYFAANNIPSLLYTALISSYLVLLIPTYKNIQEKFGDIAANKFGSSLINFILIGSTTLSVIGFFSMEYLIKLVAPGFNTETYNLAINLGKILVLSFPFSGVVLVLANISNANKKYYATQITPVFSALIVIIGLYFFAPVYGIYTLASFGVIAFVFQLFIQIAISKKHFKYSVNTAVFSKEIKKMTILALPILLGFSIDQINLLVNSIICSSLPTGNLSALTYAQRLQFTLMGTVSTAVITVVYPLMSELVAKNNKEQLMQLINKSIRCVFLIVLPIALFFSINSELIIQVVFHRGSFNDTAVLLTSKVFFFYAINVLILSIREFVLRVFYVYENTKQPLISSGLSITVNIILSLILVRFLGVEGLSLANLIATLFSLLILLWFLNKQKIIYVKMKSLISFIGKIILPVSFFVLIQIFVKESIHSMNKYLLLFIILITSIVSYYLLLLLFRQREVLETNKKVKKYLNKNIKI